MTLSRDLRQHLPQIPPLRLPTPARRQGHRVPRPLRVDPATLTKEQLSVLLHHLDPTLPPPRIRDYAAALARAERGMEAQGLHLVRTVPPPPEYRVLQVGHLVWLTDAPTLPAPPMGSRRWPDDHTIVRSVSINPKRRGSASEQRFAMYVDGMTVREYIDAVGSSHRAGMDLTNDWERGYIRVYRPDGTEVVNPLVDHSRPAVPGE